MNNDTLYIMASVMIAGITLTIIIKPLLFSKGTSDKFSSLASTPEQNSSQSFKDEIEHDFATGALDEEDYHQLLSKMQQTDDENK
jgi:hypothetical protein